LNQSYDGSTYQFFVHDCVSFTGDIARKIGLAVPMVNMSPFGLIEILAVWNKYKSKG